MNKIKKKLCSKHGKEIVVNFIETSPDMKQLLELKEFLLMSDLDFL